MDIKRILGPDDHPLLDMFLATAGESLKTFRYFSKRTYDVLKNHRVTYVGLDGDVPVCYGHLDLDGEKTWLGVCVSWNQRGKGYGRVMMEALLDFAKESGVSKIDLSVDSDNSIARRMYEKYSFVRTGEKNGVCYYVKES